MQDFDNYQNQLMSMQTELRTLIIGVNNILYR
jgi:hypothetical protein